MSSYLIHSITSPSSARTSVLRRDHVFENVCGLARLGRGTAGSRDRLIRKNRQVFVPLGLTTSDVATRVQVRKKGDDVEGLDGKLDDAVP